MFTSNSQAFWHNVSLPNADLKERTEDFYFKANVGMCKSQMRFKPNCLKERADSVNSDSGISRSPPCTASRPGQLLWIDSPGCWMCLNCETVTTSSAFSHSLQKYWLSLLFLLVEFSNRSDRSHILGFSVCVWTLGGSSYSMLNPNRWVFPLYLFLFCIMAGHHTFRRIMFCDWHNGNNLVDPGQACSFLSSLLLFSCLSFWSWHGHSIL